MEKVIEFRSKISRKSGNRYYVNIPRPLRDVVEKLHGKEVKVIIVAEDGG